MGVVVCLECCVDFLVGLAAGSRCVPTGHCVDGLVLFVV